MLNCLMHKELRLLQICLAWYHVLCNLRNALPNERGQTAPVSSVTLKVAV